MHFDLLREFVWFEKSPSIFHVHHDKSFVSSSGWTLPPLEGVWFDDIGLHKDKILTMLDSSKGKFTESQKQELKTLMQNKMNLI